ncbi:MAG: hypothetical protein LBC87_02430 [Fibromonadaceae bacterium]|jgi:hypothetical protein|nr:hypothetical protein [Fibromonadaceae bacterium]
MRKILFAATFALFASTQAFAIFGVGVHYIMNTGSLDADKGEIPFPTSGIPDEIQDIIGDKKITVNQKSASGLQGLGFKAWIDFLPYVDIEGTLNIAATKYKTSLTVPKLKTDENGIPEIVDTTINLSYSPDPPYNIIPGGSVDPLFGIVNGDLSVMYPFTDIPLIRPYIGVGFSYFASIPIANYSFAKKMLTKNTELLDALTDPENVEAAAEIKKALVNTLQKESYTTGMGGHIIAGFRIKPPIIPLAIYANGKYYIGGNTNSQFSQGFVLEAGGGFAL